MNEEVNKEVHPLDIPENLKRKPPTEEKAKAPAKTPEEVYKETVESTATSPAN